MPTPHSPAEMTARAHCVGIPVEMFRTTPTTGTGIAATLTIPGAVRLEVMSSVDGPHR